MRPLLGDNDDGRNLFERPLAGGARFRSSLVVIGGGTGRSRSLWPWSGAKMYLHEQWSYSHPKRNDNWSRGIHGFAGESRWGRSSGVSVTQRQCALAPWLVVPDNYETEMWSDMRHS